MTMNDTAPFRHESDTSREAAETLHDRRGQNMRILDYIRGAGLSGRTGDEIAVHFGIAPGTASARLSDLMNKDWCEKHLGTGGAAISKTPQRRVTRSGKKAVVHIAGRWVDRLPEGPKAAPDEELRNTSRIDQYRTRLSLTGHGHVVPRRDGTKQGCGGVNRCKACAAEDKYFSIMESKV